MIEVKPITAMIEWYYYIGWC